MFLDKYLNQVYLDLLYDKYEEWYLRNLDENKFMDIYNLFKEYGFYFINDIIIYYLEIFEYDKEMVNKGILELKEKLGENFVYIIGNNLSYLEQIKNLVNNNLAM